MRRSAPALATVALTAGLVGSGATSAWATTGDPETFTYPDVTTPPGAVQPNTPGKPSGVGTVVTPRATQATRTVTATTTLPFTGGELVLLVTAGAAALGAGGALVVAARRRPSQGL